MGKQSTKNSHLKRKIDSFVSKLRNVLEFITQHVPLINFQIKVQINFQIKVQIFHGTFCVKNKEESGHSLKLPHGMQNPRSAEMFEQSILPFKMLRARREF